MSTEDDISRKIRDFDQSFEIAEKVQKRKLRQSFLNQADNLIEQANLDAQWGDIHNAAMKRMLAQMYLDMARDF